MSPPTTSQQDTSNTTKPTIYFGYGSNLWLSQMSQRCPTAKYLGVARLNGFKWIINDRGYANVVEVNTTSTSTSTSTSTQTSLSPSPTNSTSYDTTVYGLAYTLLPPDESSLDKNEGVPIAYTKEYLPCDFWSAGAEPSDPLSVPHEKVNTTLPPDSQMDMLVYIDRVRTTPDKPRREYVYRMNRGIEDAVGVGVPAGYVEGVLRRYVPGEKEEEGGGDGDEGVGEFARAQARGFRDESGVFE